MGFVRKLIEQPLGAMQRPTGGGRGAGAERGLFGESKSLGVKIIAKGVCHDWSFADLHDLCAALCASFVSICVSSMC